MRSPVRPAIGHHPPMDVMERTPNSATLKLSLRELLVLNNALNEVCNNVRDLGDDSEFATRLGVSREDGRALLREVGAALDETP
jgi:hypothetical protein